MNTRNTALVVVASDTTARIVSPWQRKRSLATLLVSVNAVAPPTAGTTIRGRQIICCVTVAFVPSTSALVEYGSIAATATAPVVPTGHVTEISSISPMTGLAYSVMATVDV